MEREEYLPVAKPLPVEGGVADAEGNEPAVVRMPVGGGVAVNEGYGKGVAGIMEGIAGTREGIAVGMPFELAATEEGIRIRVLL